MRTNKKAVILMIALLFLSVVIAGSVFAGYGSGGGGGGGGGGSESDGPQTKETSPSGVVTEYTREELEEFFAGLPEGVREMVIDKQEGKPRTPAQLNLIRNIFLDAESWNQQSQAAIWESYEEVAVVLDKAGQSAELALAFTTGGTSTLITGTLFGATRAGVNEYSKGKSTEEILQAIAVAVAVDNIMKVKGLKKIGDRGGELVDMVSRASKLNKNPKVTEYLIKVGIKAGLYKEGEKLTKDMIGSILNSMANQAKKAQAPQAPSTTPPMTTYMGPGEYDETPTGQKLYK